MNNEQKLKEAIRIITTAAHIYKDAFVGRNYIFIYKNRVNNNIEYFESIFLANNFQHLTGIEFIDNNGYAIENSVWFYQKCINKTLKVNEIRFKTDGTTELKLQALPLMVNFLKSSKMTGIYSFVKPKLIVDRLVGTTNFCLGFIKTGKYYAPSSCLLEDVRDLTSTPNQILAIFAKSASKSVPIYSEVKYIAKGVNFKEIKLPERLSDILDLSNVK